MGHKHIIEFFTHILEDRKAKNTIHDIEGCGLGILVMNNEDVLSSKKATEKRLGILVYSLFHATIVPKSISQVNAVGEKSFFKKMLQWD
jgi:hypothetical protein